MTGTAPVYVQDGSFFVSDTGVTTLFETMDFSTGLADIVHIDGGVDPGSADRRRAYRAAMRRHSTSTSV
jgi:hypothetical protein